MEGLQAFFDKYVEDLPDTPSDRLVKSVIAHLEDVYRKREEIAQADHNFGWSERGREILGGLTPLEFVRTETGDPADEEKYKTLIFNVMDADCYVPVDVFEDFLARCPSGRQWISGLTQACCEVLENTREDDVAYGKAAGLFDSISMNAAGMDDSVFDRLIKLAEKMYSDGNGFYDNILRGAFVICKNSVGKSLDVIEKELEEKGELGEIPDTLVSMLSFSSNKDERIYALLRRLVKRTPPGDKLLMYVYCVRDYGDKRAVSFLRTKVKSVLDNMPAKMTEEENRKINASLSAAINTVKAFGGNVDDLS